MDVSSPEKGVSSTTTSSSLPKQSAALPETQNDDPLSSSNETVVTLNEVIVRQRKELAEMEALFCRMLADNIRLQEAVEDALQKELLYIRLLKQNNIL